MSLEAADQFRTDVNENAVLRTQVESALARSSYSDLVTLGAQSGYQFSESEAEEKLGAYTSEAELSDWEMELVSGGGNQPTATADQTGSIKG